MGLRNLPKFSSVDLTSKNRIQIASFCQRQDRNVNFHFFGKTEFVEILLNSSNCSRNLSWFCGKKHSISMDRGAVQKKYNHS